MSDSTIQYVIKSVMVIEPTPPKVALDEEQDSDCAEQSQKGRKKRLLWLGGACLLTAGAIIAIPRLTSQSPPDRKSTRLNSSHITRSRMPSSA